MQYVLNPDDLDWAEVDSAGHPSTDFMFTPTVIDKDYTGSYSSRLGLMRPSTGSGMHTDPYNHAFYFLRGTGEVQIGEAKWSLQPGTILKIPAGKEHELSNTGSDDLVFLVIYDPPHWSARGLGARRAAEALSVSVSGRGTLASPRRSHPRAFRGQSGRCPAAGPVRPGCHA
jgi:quercetin dioxygenase-like cupin family protein